MVKKYSVLFSFLEIAFLAILSIIIFYGTSDDIFKAISTGSFKEISYTVQIQGSSVSLKGIAAFLTHSVLFLFAVFILIPTVIKMTLNFKQELNN